MKFAEFKNLFFNGNTNKGKLLKKIKIFKKKNILVTN